MHYPLFLDLRSRSAIVVGAGKVAARKIRALLRAGARVTVIAPQAGKPIQRLARSKRIRWARRRYQNGDLRRACLVVAATDDEAVNRRVCAEANRRAVLVNCVAPPEAGNFIVPSVVRRGGLMIAISTGGASPALAKQIRRGLEEFLRNRYAGLGVTIRSLRRARKTRRAAG